MSYLRRDYSNLYWDFTENEPPKTRKAETKMAGFDWEYARNLQQNGTSTEPIQKETSIDLSQIDQQVRNSHNAFFNGTPGHQLIKKSEVEAHSVVTECQLCQKIICNLVNLHTKEKEEEPTKENFVYPMYKNIMDKKENKDNSSNNQNGFKPPSAPSASQMTYNIPGNESKPRVPSSSFKLPVNNQITSAQVPTYSTLPKNSTVNSSYTPGNNQIPSAQVPTYSTLPKNTTVKSSYTPGNNQIPSAQVPTYSTLPKNTTVKSSYTPGNNQIPSAQVPTYSTLPKNTAVKSSYTPGNETPLPAAISSKSSMNWSSTKGSVSPKAYQFSAKSSENKFPANNGQGLFPSINYNEYGRNQTSSVNTVPTQFSTSHNATRLPEKIMNTTTPVTNVFNVTNQMNNTCNTSQFTNIEQNKKATHQESATVDNSDMNPFLRGILNHQAHLKRNEEQKTREEECGKNLHLNSNCNEKQGSQRPTDQARQKAQLSHEKSNQKPEKSQEGTDPAQKTETDKSKPAKEPVKEKPLMINKETQTEKDEEIKENNITVGINMVTPQFMYPRGNYRAYQHCGQFYRAGYDPRYAYYRYPYYP